MDVAFGDVRRQEVSVGSAAPQAAADCTRAQATVALAMPAAAPEAAGRARNCILTGRTVTVPMTLRLTRNRRGQAACPAASLIQPWLTWCAGRGS